MELSFLGSGEEVATLSLTAGGARARSDRFFKKYRSRFLKFEMEKMLVCSKNLQHTQSTFFGDDTCIVSTLNYLLQYQESGLM